MQSLRQSFHFVDSDNKLHKGIHNICLDREITIDSTSPNCHLLSVFCKDSPVKFLTGDYPTEVKTFLVDAFEVRVFPLLVEYVYQGWNKKSRRVSVLSEFYARILSPET